MTNKGNNDKRVTLSRYGSLEVTVANDKVTNDSGNNKSKPETSCNVKELNNKRKSNTSKRLHFEEKYDDTQTAANNNATIVIPVKKA